jgi:hypothetical protein
VAGHREFTRVLVLVRVRVRVLVRVRVRVRVLVRVRVRYLHILLSMATRRTNKDFASAAIAGSASACIRRSSTMAPHSMAEHRAIAW